MGFFLNIILIILFKENFIKGKKSWKTKDEGPFKKRSSMHGFEGHIRTPRLFFFFEKKMVDNMFS